MSKIEEGWAHYQEGMEEMRALLGDEVADLLVDALRAFGLAVLDEAEALSQYSCHATCDHHEDYCLTTQRNMLRRRIEELGK